ncbi:MAG: hypothetical protein PF447_14735, partial [Spirochaetaceae bacterium]|nr:hypothetical protein [Spirochaetaceae bacterium]
VELELIEPIEPFQVEVVNLSKSQKLDYPAFFEISLDTQEVDLQGYFIETLDLTLDNTKLGADPLNFIFNVDGSCVEKHLQMSFNNQRVQFQTLFEYRGSYSYDPQDYKLTMTFNEIRQAGGEWESQSSLMVTDYYLINSEGIYDIFFPETENLWQKLRIERSEDSQENLFILRGMSIEDNRFSFFQERRQGDPNKEEPDYQRSRQYDLKGRAGDPLGQVFYLEDSLLFKNDYVYFYNITNAVVLRLTIGE